MSIAGHGDALPPIADRYPQPGLRVARVLPRTGRNVTAILTDAHRDSYVLRCHRRNPDPDRIRFQLDFQEHLLGRGLPTAEIIATRAGERLVTEHGRTWVLFRHIAGTAYDHANPRQLRHAARCLADLHGSARDFAGAPVVDETIPDVRRWWTYGAEDLAELHAMFAGRGVDAELAFLDRWWAGLMRDLPIEVVDQLPTVWVHSDFHGGNLAFDRDRVAGVFDFDVVHRGYRLEDVGCATFWFARESATSDRIRPAAAAAFQEPFDLTSLERAALPAFLVATQARNAARYRVRLREGADLAAVLRRHVGRMRHLSTPGC